MIPLGKLKHNLEFNNSLGNIIEVLKIGASIQLRQFQTRSPLCKDFMMELKECVSMLETEKMRHPFLVLRKDLPRCIVGVTSEGGFLGELNTLIINSLLDEREDSSKDIVIVLGERGASYLRDVGISPIVFHGITEELLPQEVENLKGYLIKEYLKGKISEIIMIYPRFKTITTQRIASERLLPCSFTPLDSEYLTGFKLTEQEIKQKEEKKSGFLSTKEEMLIEPRLKDVIEELVRLWVGFMISDIFWSSKLSEFAARLMHLDGSQQRLSKINQTLRLEYFRYVHMLADKTIREISASRFLRKV